LNLEGIRRSLDFPGEQAASLNLPPVSPTLRWRTLNLVTQIIIPPLGQALLFPFHKFIRQTS